MFQIIHVFGYKYPGAKPHGAKALGANRSFNGTLFLFVCQHCHVLPITESVGKGKHAHSFPKMEVC